MKKVKFTIIIGKNIITFQSGKLHTFVIEKTRWAMGINNKKEDYKILTVDNIKKI